MGLVRYVFHDKNDEEFGTYTTTHYNEAQEYASSHKLKVIEETYTFDDSELVLDYTDSTEEEE